MKKIFVRLALGALLFAHSLSAEVQQTNKVPVIGYISGLSRTSESIRLDSLRQGLHDLGYIEGQNILIEYRFGEGKNDRLAGLAADLVRLNVDVIVAGGAAATGAVQQATKKIPIVMAYMADPVGLGFVASLAKPGGNITGLSQLAPELGGKRLELLKEVVPHVSRMAVLGTPQTDLYAVQMKELKVAARAVKVQLQPVDLRGSEDLETAFALMVKGRAGAFIALTSSPVSFNRTRIVNLAAQRKLPAMYPFTEFVDAGGLMCYAPNYADLFRRAATYVDKIVKGTKPADIPVEQPKKFEFIINLKAAKQIGLIIPPNVLARADRVIR